MSVWLPVSESDGINQSNIPQMLHLLTLVVEDQDVITQVAVDFLILVPRELIGEFTRQRMLQTQQLDTYKVVFTLSGII